MVGVQLEQQEQKVLEAKDHKDQQVQEEVKDHKDQEVLWQQLQEAKDHNKEVLEQQVQEAKDHKDQAVPPRSSRGQARMSWLLEAGVRREAGALTQFLLEFSEGDWRD